MSTSQLATRSVRSQASYADCAAALKVPLQPQWPEAVAVLTRLADRDPDTVWTLLDAELIGLDALRSASVRAKDSEPPTLSTATPIQWQEPAQLALEIRQVRRSEFELTRVVRARQRSNPGRSIPRAAGRRPGRGAEARSATQLVAMGSLPPPRSLQRQCRVSLAPLFRYS